MVCAIWLVQGSGKSLTFATTANLTVSGAIADYSSLTGMPVYANGPGLLVLAGANTYVGTTTISGGTLQIGGGGSSGALAGNGSIIDNSVLALNRGDSALNVANAISGSGSLICAGSGLVTLSGGNSYTGPTAVNSGTLAVGGAGVLGGGNYAGAISNSGALVVHTSNNQTFSGGMSGTGALVAGGAGTLTLNTSTTADTYYSNAISGAGPLVLNGTTLHYLGLNFSNSAGMTGYGGAATVTGNVSETNAGLDTGSAAASFNETAGAYWLASNEAGTTTVNLGALSGSGVLTGAGFLSGRNGTKTFSIGALGTNTTYSGTIQDNYPGGGTVVALTKVGSGMLTLAGANNYTGGTTVNGGTLTLNDGNTGDRAQARLPAAPTAPFPSEPA